MTSGHEKTTDIHGHPQKQSSTYAENKPLIDAVEGGWKSDLNDLKKKFYKLSMVLKNMALCTQQLLS